MGASPVDAPAPSRRVIHRRGTSPGTTRRDGAILANGGRVLNVTARGDSLAEARDRAYAMVDVIDWPEGFCRRDIGWRAL